LYSPAEQHLFSLEQSASLSHFSEICELFFKELGSGHSPNFSLTQMAELVEHGLSLLRLHFSPNFI